MSLLRSIDGRLYDVPDGELAQFEVPEETLDRILADLEPDDDCDPGPPEDAGAAPQVVIYVSGGEEDFDPGPPDGFDG